MNLMIVHAAIQDKPVPGRLLEGEVRLPVLAAPLREDESSLREIDGGDIRSERIVDALKGHPIGKIEDGAPPTGRVGEERRSWLSVDRHLLHIPYAIERRERLAQAHDFPGAPDEVAGCACEPQTEYDLHSKCDPVGPDAAKELRLRGKRRGLAQQQESDQAWNVGGQEKAAEQDEGEDQQR